MSRIDFVTGAPIRYAEIVSDVANLSNLTKKAIEQKITEKKSKKDTSSNEEEWSTHRILCHMLNYSSNINLLITRMLVDTDPKQIKWNENSIYENLKQKEKPTISIFNQFKENIEELVATLSKTPDAAWGRSGNHVYLGKISVKQLVKWHCNHLVQHINQINDS
ncbi:MAG: hypothetical protein ACJ0J6_00440 [Dehalococcoidia bacterium]|tara:strand:+ start:10137 stop:10628 length:492 start_codon:yes stop_codon:yes gene_type:complete